MKNLTNPDLLVGYLAEIRDQVSGLRYTLSMNSEVNVWEKLDDITFIIGEAKQKCFSLDK